MLTAPPTIKQYPLLPFSLFLADEDQYLPLMPRSIALPLALWRLPAAGRNTPLLALLAPLK